MVAGHIGVGVVEMFTPAACKEERGLTHVSDLVINLQIVKAVGMYHSGEANGQSKITKDDVIAIFYAKGTLRSIGNKYGISLEMAGQIKRKERWKHVTKDLL